MAARNQSAAVRAAKGDAARRAPKRKKRPTALGSAMEIAATLRETPPNR
jgi:hypothetical protein